VTEGQPHELEPVYPTLEDILELHGLIIGGTAALAKDLSLSAGTTPAQLAEFIRSALRSVAFR
jgi:hypothetical protein